jgi:hypothetical protein
MRRCLLGIDIRDGSDLPGPGGRGERNRPTVAASLPLGKVRLGPLRARAHTLTLPREPRAGRNRLRVARYRGRVDWLLLIAPLLAIQLALIIVALRDLFRPERRVRGGAKWIWVLVIVFLELLGPLLYFTVGREEE